MSCLYMVRGVSGSGKSTLAQKLFSRMKIFESDQFFMVGDQYKFDRQHLQAAHDWCYNSVYYEVFRGHDVCVANTFTQTWEMKRFFQLKDVFPDLQINVYEVKTQFRNVHNVPEDIVEKMKNRWQDIPKGIIDKYQIGVIQKLL